MGTRAVANVVAFVAVTAVSLSVSAQRRDGGTAKSVFRVEIPVSAIFGEVQVPARHYRVSLGPDGMALADPTTMILMATIPVERLELSEPVKEPKVEVKRTKTSIEIVLLHGSTMVWARGTIATELERAQAGGRVVLVGKEEATIDRGDPKELNDVQVINNLIKRYFSSIKHCADKAHRNRWATDDPRFVKCVCPIVSKWRMPQLKSELRTHHSLSKGRTGFSITTSTKGRIVDCRVWIGPNPPPPKETTNKGAQEPREAPVSAPTSSEGSP